MTQMSGITLGLSGPDGRARAKALEAAAAVAARPTSLVDYRSTGAVVIIGPEAAALAAAERLRPALHCTVVVQEDAASAPEAARAPAGAPPDVVVVREKVIQVSGHLGQFAVIVAASGSQGGANLLQKLGSQRTQFDLVLDLCQPPFLGEELAPFGYYAPAGHRDRLEQALLELPDMVGEFEKPRFFNYNPDICAHGASGLTGCTRCIDVCPAGAIISMREEVAVDPYLCQGAGACSTACPTGAMTYAYPALSDQLARVRALLTSYRSEGGRTPIVLFHDAETGRARLQALAPHTPEHVVPLEIAELGSVGMEVWLSALAYGASAVFLLPTHATSKRVYAEVQSQLGYAQAVIDGMGYAPERIALLSGDDEEALATLSAAPPAPLAQPASFAVHDEKRTALRLAIEHLYERAPAPRAEAALPAGAPFGQIFVKRDACTLCMSCAGVCPAGALADGGDLPQLRFIEDNCVQCGLCATACPEGAITLGARYLYDPEARRTAHVMHEEAPFHCVSCGKPFASQKMMTRMSEKLQGHWMFRSGEALRRIQMCADCRVRDMFTAESKREAT